MIFVTRMKGQRVALNPELITSVECAPDTTIRFANGETVLVRESMASVVDRILDYRRSLVAAVPVASSVAPDRTHDGGQ